MPSCCPGRCGPPRPRRPPAAARATCSPRAGPSSPGAEVDLEYAVLVDPLTALTVREDHTGAAVFVLAARVGTTRLIDNAPLRLGRQNVEHA